MEALAMRFTARLSIAVVTMWFLSGYPLSDPGAREAAAADVTMSDVSAGYALLYEVASKQKRSNLLSFIKKEPPEVKALLGRISETSKATADELETLAKASPPLDLKLTQLPRIERATRDSIEKETSKDVLVSKGVDLEFAMLSSQLAGLNYAAHLARSLAAVETGPARKDFLQRTDRRYSELRDQVYKMIFTRYKD
jgi:hypothetical protein